MDQKLSRIHSARTKPVDAAVSVKYRSAWFYIDDSDLESKRVFALMTLLFSLADTSTRENLPLITILPRYAFSHKINFNN